MNKLAAICAALLALPLVVFGSNYFLHFFALPTDASAGEQLLQAMRDGGLMAAIAASHVLAGVLLLVPRTRFFGALVQLPLTLGMVAFHATMTRPGLVTAIPMLLLNLGALSEPGRLRALLAPRA